LALGDVMAKQACNECRHWHTEQPENRQVAAAGYRECRHPTLHARTIRGQTSHDYLRPDDAECSGFIPRQQPAAR
jgi:hypothetical protein